MNYHKLLQKQIAKHLTPELTENPEVKKFLKVINESYEALQRDKLLLERAFSVSEEEHIDLNNKLSYEIEIKKKSIQKLKNTLGVIGVNDQSENSDDLLAIAEYLNQQSIQRKSAEKIFTSLVNNSHSGILLEDENRKIGFTNQLFCTLFNLPAAPENLIGVDCSQSAQQAKHLFKNAEEFVKIIEEILEKKVFVTLNLTLADQRILRMQYIPIFIDDFYKGHLWSYTDITEKLKAQEALEQSELKSRLIMNSSLDAIITVNKGGLISLWNPQAEKIFGWKETEVIGKSLIDHIIPAPHKKRFEEYMKRKHKAGKESVLNKMMELAAMNIKGEEFPIELSITPIKQGDTEFFCWFIRDISDRKKNEEALKASQELWKFALEGAGDGVWEYDMEHNKVFFSKQYKLMLGFNEEEFANTIEVWKSRIHPEDIPSIEATDKAYINGEVNSHQREYRILHKNGEYIWVLDRGMLVNRTPIGSPQRSIGTLSDITHRKLSEQALSKNEAKYRSIITNMNLGLLEVDSEEYIQFANQTFCKMSGFSESELINAKATELLTLNDDNHIIASKNKLRKEGVSDASEVSVRNKSGQLRWWLISGAPKLNDKGENVGSVGIHLDITEQKKLEHELIKAKEAAEASTEAKEAFLANMSHEIRTPMNAISGMANQLNKTKLDINQQFFLNTIRSSADHLLVIINDILDLSKIESGKLSIEKIGFEPKQIIGHVLEVMRHRAEEKGLKFTNSFCDNKLSAVLIGDPFRLSQIMLNLVSNAIKFTAKGMVDISCKILEDLANEQIFEVKVQDTGVGMEKKFVVQLFEKFSQEDGSVTRKYGGTGLGMSICKQLLGLMDGEIKVTSKKNYGTTVSCILRMPKGTKKDLPEKENQEVDTALLFAKNILVTDDNEINRLLASTILSNFGANITEACNGEEAIANLKVNNFDLILMDVQMPVMDGLEATALIRKTLKNDIPIIALTAFALKGDNQKCFDAGMDDYLSKPFEETQLLEIASKWLSKPSEASKLYSLSLIDNIAQGNRPFIAKMIGLFIDQLGSSLNTLKKDYTKEDFDSIAKTAHRIRPSIDSLNITCLKADMLEIEKYAVTYGKSKRLEFLLKKLEHTLNQVIDDLKKNYR